MLKNQHSEQEPYKQSSRIRRDMVIDLIAATVLRRQLFLDVACARQRKCEACSLPFGALHRECALHCAGEIAAYRQPQADTALPVGQPLSPLNEWLENGFQLFPSDPDPRIDDAQCDCVVDTGTLGPDVPALRCELD